VHQRTELSSLLAASARSPEIPEAADVYGCLWGSRDLGVLASVADLLECNRRIRQRYFDEVCSADAQFLKRQRLNCHRVMILT
jgi:hypothetical protein